MTYRKQINAIRQEINIPMLPCHCGFINYIIRLMKRYVLPYIVTSSIKDKIFGLFLEAVDLFSFTTLKSFQWQSFTKYGCRLWF